MTNKELIPNHIAIIMDGNGRWANQRGEERLSGHRYSLRSVRIAIEYCINNGVKWLTLYAFSTENWNRPKNEVEGLMALFCEAIGDEIEELTTNGVRLRFMGCKEGLPDNVIENMNIAEKLTEGNNKLNLTLAINYGGHQEIVDAVKDIALSVKNGSVDINSIDSNMISSKMYIKDMPNPDLMIRTSGECRISNFMLWQLSYSELYFTNVLWPDLTTKDMDDAIEEYGSRNRRYGAL